MRMPLPPRLYPAPPESVIDCRFQYEVENRPQEIR